MPRSTVMNTLFENDDFALQFNWVKKKKKLFFKWNKLYVYNFKLYSKLFLQLYVHNFKLYSKLLKSWSTMNQPNKLMIHTRLMSVTLHISIFEIHQWWTQVDVYKPNHGTNLVCSSQLSHYMNITVVYCNNGQ